MTELSRKCPWILMTLVSRFHAEMWETASSFFDFNSYYNGCWAGMIVGGGHQRKLLQVVETQERWQRSLNSRL